MGLTALGGVAAYSMLPGYGASTAPVVDASTVLNAVPAANNKLGADASTVPVDPLRVDFSVYTKPDPTPRYRITEKGLEELMKKSDFGSISTTQPVHKGFSKTGLQ